jgi:hypothetical protein
MYSGKIAVPPGGGGIGVTNEQSENENVQTVNKQSELTSNVNEAKISTRGRKIIVSNKYKDYVCN